MPHASQGPPQLRDAGRGGVHQEGAVIGHDQEGDGRTFDGGATLGVDHLHQIGSRHPMLPQPHMRGEPGAVRRGGVVSGRRACSGVSGGEPGGDVTLARENLPQILRNRRVLRVSRHE